MASVCQIHLRSEFDHVLVRVSVDNSQVFSDTATTNPVVSLANIIPIQVINGVHSLRVTVSNRFLKDSSFVVRDTLYIGVWYTRQDSLIELYYSRERFIYD